MFIIGGIQKAMFDKIFLDADANASPMLLLEFLKAIEKIGISISVFIFFYSLLGAFFALLFSHRISGPLIALQKHICRLKDGDYLTKISLRKGDELKVLEKELNELTDILKNRK